jgi:hypothetical protein
MRFDQAGHVQEGHIGDVANPIAAQVQNAQGTQAIQGGRRDFGESVRGDGEFLKHGFQAAERVLLDQLDLVVVQHQFLDTHSQEGAGTNL